MQLPEASTNFLSGNIAFHTDIMGKRFISCWLLLAQNIKTFLKVVVRDWALALRWTVLYPSPTNNELDILIHLIEFQIALKKTKRKERKRKKRKGKGKKKWHKTLVLQM